LRAVYEELARRARDHGAPGLLNLESPERPQEGSV
jgi:hypothetical protein